MDEGIEVEGWQVRILHFDVGDHWVMVGAELHLARPVVVQVWESHLNSSAPQVAKVLPTVLCTEAIDGRRKLCIP